jgi:hypothetical protein
MQSSLQIINQVFEIQTKLNDLNEASSFERNMNRLFAIFEDEGFVVKNPINEIYQESRTDCEASIVGNTSSKMKITKVLKPIIYQKNGEQMQLVQKAIVIVEQL